MERFALAGLLVLVLPSVALGQGFEVAVFAGAYQRVPATRSVENADLCDNPPCPTHYTDARSLGAALGGRLSIHFTRRFGIDATVQRVTAPSMLTFYNGSVVDRRSRGEVTATLSSVQPYVRAQLGDVFQIRLAAGPALAAGLTATGTRFVLGASAAISARVARTVALEVSASDTHLVGRHLEGNRNHITAHVGLVWRKPS